MMLCDLLILLSTMFLVKRQKQVGIIIIVMKNMIFLSRLRISLIISGLLTAKKCGEPSVTHCVVGDLNVLILNTNWRNPPEMKPGYYCVHCEKVQEAIKKCDKSCGTMSIVLAHKPIYEICETARLSYKRYIKTPFMAALQDFVGNNGIYFCGDKHTRSIVGSYFHDIPHYIGGEPLTIKNSKQSDYEVEYNLIEVTNILLGMDRKIHLRSKNGKKRICELRPQDAITSKLYDLSKETIFYKGIMPSEQVLDFPVDCNTLTGSVNL